MVELFYIIAFFITPMIWVVWFAVQCIKDFDESCERQRREAQRRHAVKWEDMK